MKIYAIIGTGGMGQETMALAALQLPNSIQANFKLVYAVEDGYPTDPVAGHRVETLRDLFAKSTDQIFYTVAIADSNVRRKITDECERHHATPFNIVAKESLVYEGSSYGPGAILAPFSMISTNSHAGKSLHLNYYACITHDCTVGDFVTFGPKAQCNGNVVIHNGAYIGAGAQIIQGNKSNPVVIGENSIIGMGAVVLNNVDPNTTVAGNPARVIKSGLITV